jgi:hypothetical protein
MASIPKYSRLAGYYPPFDYSAAETKMAAAMIEQIVTARIERVKIKRPLEMWPRPSTKEERFRLAYGATIKRPDNKA